MVKILLSIVMFLVVGFTASANSHEIKDQEKTDSSQAALAFELVYSCGEYTVTVCCFETYLDAAFYAAFTPSAMVCAMVPVNANP